jgi:hypothetical protein
MGAGCGVVDVGICVELEFMGGEEFSFDASSRLSIQSCGLLICT